MSTREKTVEAVATASSIFLSGVISSISTIAIPAILSMSVPNDALLRQWKTVYDRGSKQNATMATLAGLAHGGIAYRKWTRGEDAIPSLLAAVFTIGIVPYTGLVMLPTNKRLFREVEKGEKLENIRSLIEKWSLLNNVRAYLPMIGGISSLIGIFGWRLPF